MTRAPWNSQLALSSEQDNDTSVAAAAPASGCQDAKRTAVTHKDPGRYTVKTIAHASRVLNAFDSYSEVLRLRDVVVRTGFTKGMCFRLLYTLKFLGFLEQVRSNQYRLMTKFLPHRTHGIGYSSQCDPDSFVERASRS